MIWRHPVVPVVAAAQSGVPALLATDGEAEAQVVVGIVETGAVAEAGTEVIGHEVAVETEGGDLVAAVGLAGEDMMLARDAKETYQNLRKILCTRAW